VVDVPPEPVVVVDPVLALELAVPAAPVVPPPPDALEDEPAPPVLLEVPWPLPVEGLGLSVGPQPTITKAISLNSKKVRTLLIRLSVSEPRFLFSRAAIGHRRTMHRVGR